MATYERPRRVSFAAWSTVSGQPAPSMVAATSKPDGRVVGVPSAYRTSSPTAQPKRNDRLIVATEVVPAATGAMPMAASTTALNSPQRPWPNTRATVTNPVRPATRKSSATRSFREVCPVSASSSCVEPYRWMSSEMPNDSVAASASATTASSSCRGRRRTSRSIPIATGRTSTPNPATSAIATRSSEGSCWPALVMSTSTPLMVAVRKYVTATMSALARTAVRVRTRSKGRRTRRGMTPSSMTTVRTSDWPWRARACIASVSASRRRSSAVRGSSTAVGRASGVTTVSCWSVAIGSAGSGVAVPGAPGSGAPGAVRAGGGSVTRRSSHPQGGIAQHGRPRAGT